MQVASALEVLSDQTSGQLQQLAREMRPTVEEHLKQAKQIMKGSDGQQQAGRERTQTNR
jgi:hypothetical protein